MSILIILVAILFGLLAIWFWRVSRLLESSIPVVGGLGFKKYVHRFMDPSRYGYKYLISGELKMPRKIYIGNSHNISLLLHAEEQEVETTPIHTHLVGTSHIVLNVWLRHGCKNFLEAELQAAAATVSGERTQRVALPSREILYRWNCLFQNSGKHEICVILRQLSGSPRDEEQATEDIEEVGTIVEKIKVVKLDGLTQLQVWVLASLLGVISGVIALVKISYDIGIWKR